MHRTAGGKQLTASPRAASHSQPEVAADVRSKIEGQMTMSHMNTTRVGIIMNGVTGRMGTNQHLIRSIVAIIKQGGVPLGADCVIMPDPILVGRNPAKLERLAAATGLDRWTTDLDGVLGDPEYTVYFDAQTTGRRPDAVKRAIAAAKHVYCEKPTALTTQDAYELYQCACEAGVKHGVVQDKLWLPGLRKLRILKDSGFFGDILAVRGEFGYWVFEGDVVEPQRPSWNYRKQDGGGIILDMFCHWRYVLDNLVSDVRAVSAIGATLIPERIDEAGKSYACTADDTAFGTFELAGGIYAQFNSSWVTRVNRDDLVTIQIDGTKGSAVAGLRSCKIQPYGATPRAIWNPDVADPNDYLAGWTPMPEHEPLDNAFKAQWELFLRHVVADDPFPWDLLEGAKGVQLAEKGIESWKKRAWVDVPPLS
jgi:predicted dehydrogenase